MIITLLLLLLIIIAEAALLIGWVRYFRQERKNLLWLLHEEYRLRAKVRDRLRISQELQQRLEDALRELHKSEARGGPIGAGPTLEELLAQEQLIEDEYQRRKAEQ